LRKYIGGYVRIEGGKILDLGREPASSAQVCVEEDLEGMMVGPGFIDTYTWSSWL